jgi:hypothetical protein
MTVELQALGIDDSQCSVRSLETDDVFDWVDRLRMTGSLIGIV